MRAFWLFLLAPTIAGAQFPAPQMSGVLLERDGDVLAGQLAVRAADNQVYRFRFDGKTAVRRDDLPSDVARINAGDRVEVASEPVTGSLLRYARVIQVYPAPVAKLTLADSRLRAPARPVLEHLPLTGTLTYSGVVSRLNSQLLVLRTRGGEQNLIIRKDTHYVDNGGTVEAMDLRPNMRVFVRAGKNLYEQVEAYQVIWGSILVPKE